MIEREDRAPIAVLRLAHGKASALDAELLTALAEQLDEIERSAATAVVLTGTGTIFSAGVDLFRVLDGGNAYLDRFLPAFTRTMKRLFTFPLPVVAAINGHAVAGGCVLASACDYRIMVSAHATIGVPELRVGVPFPGVALEILRFATPGPHFQELVYLGRTYRPDEAVARGLVDETAEAASLLNRAVEVARRFVDIPARTFRVTKQQVRQSALDCIARHEREHDPEVFAAWRAPETAATIEDYVDRVIRRGRAR